MYTLVILLSIVTSMCAAPLVRLTARGEYGEEERRRLEHEDELDKNVVVRGQRLLLPSRGAPNSVAAAQLLDSAWPDSSEVTVMSITDRPRAPADSQGVLAAFRGRTVRRRRVTSERVLDELLLQANLGYGVIGVGTVEFPSPGKVLPPVVEGLLNRSPIPLVIVRHGEHAPELDESDHAHYDRILVPVTGTAASRAGQEVANNISRRTGGEMTLLHALTRPRSEEGEGPDTTWMHARDGWPGTHSGSAAVGAATAILDAAQETSAMQGVRPHLGLRHGSSAALEIEAALDEYRPDLVVLGATVRRVAGRPFLGHTVEHLLEHATEPTVVVVVLPDAAAKAASGTDAHTDRSIH